jgi:hypothetical protein
MDELRKTNAIALVALAYVRMYKLNWKIATADYLPTIGFNGSLGNGGFVLDFGETVLCFTKEVDMVENLRNLCNDIVNDKRRHLCVLNCAVRSRHGSVLAYSNICYNNDSSILQINLGKLSYAYNMTKSEVLKFRDIANAVEAHA